VGSYLPNPFGLHDVHGNVWELCLDGWDASFYQRGAAKDPLCRPEESLDRANRGGSWGTAATYARSACRDLYPPLGFDRFLGVRPARALTTP
jgi:formylglycine-generating enzyme required for sulfatase activity